MALSPMMQHYLATKEQYKDCILMYRLGDFYEMFFDDAVTVSKALELTLTGRDCGLEERAPMCGVPYHAVDNYIGKLVEKGFRVAICEQMEDPALAKGLVERAVTRVITPGTVIETNILEEKKNNYLLALSLDADGKKAGLAYADVSTGEMFVLELPVPQLGEELTRIAPTEVLVRAQDRASLESASGSLCATIRPAEDFDKKGAAALLRKHMHKSLTQLGLTRMENAVCASGALLLYLEETQKNALAHLNSVRLYNRGGAPAARSDRAEQPRTHGDHARPGQARHAAVAAGSHADGHGRPPAARLDRGAADAEGADRAQAGRGGGDDARVPDDAGAHRGPFADL